MRLVDISFSTKSPKVLGEWLHLVGVYYGPNEGEGITLYVNGIQAERDTTQAAMSSVILGSGKLVAGRKRTEINDRYASVEVDEILLFNRKLSSLEVQMIYNATKD